MFSLFLDFDDDFDKKIAENDFSWLHAFFTGQVVGLFIGLS